VSVSLEIGRRDGWRSSRLTDGRRTECIVEKYRGKNIEKGRDSREHVVKYCSLVARPSSEVLTKSFTLCTPSFFPSPFPSPSLFLPLSPPSSSLFFFMWAVATME
jgi:hypothetical protein